MEPAQGTKPQDTKPKDGGLACPLCRSTQVLPFLTAPDRFHLRPEKYDLWRCTACRGVWLDKPPLPAEMGRHYSENYHQAIMKGGEHAGLKRWEGHRNIIGRYKQQGDILDIGCSSGSFLASMNNGSWKLYGIEMSEATAEKARLKAGADVFVGDVMDAPFPANSFDVVTCFDVLEHVYQPREFLEQVLHWLRPGGIFYARLPNIDSWESRFFGTYWYGLELPRHLYHFCPNSLQRLVSELGFEAVSISASGIGTHAGHSVRYVCGAALQKLGFSPRPMAVAKNQSFAWRAIRKAMMLSVVYPLSRIASAANAGVVIDVVLKKPTD